MLDTKYFDKIGKALNAIIAQRSEPFQGTNSLSDQHLACINTIGLAVQQTGTKRKVYRVGPTGDNGQVETELVIRMQGIVSSAELIPSGHILRWDHDKIRRLSQQIQIVGEGSTLFEQAVRNTRVLRELFVRFFVGQKCSEWNVGQHDDRSYINASCHYFSATGDAPQTEVAPFNAATDPMGVAQRVLDSSDGRLVRTEDNVVEYFKLDTDKETREETYYTTFPGVFRSGDIVEIHGTLMAFTNKQGAVKLHFHLQTITLLNSEYSKAAEAARLQDVARIERPVMNLRRRHPYQREDADMKGARKKFRALNVAASDNDGMDGVEIET